MDTHVCAHPSRQVYFQHGLFLIGGFGLLVWSLFGGGVAVPFPALDAHLDVGLAFGLGLLTGFHCIGMCGGLVLAYATRSAQRGGSPWRAHVAYGAGKTLSYALLGGVAGALGGALVLTTQARGWVGILSGLSLIIASLWVMRLVKTPRAFKLMSASLVRRVRLDHPFAVGMLNGTLISCGTLQAMYLYAAGTGDPAYGALLLGVYSIGTLPSLVGFALLTVRIKPNHAQLIHVLSGLIVLFLAFAMLNRGLRLLGVNLTASSALAAQAVDQGDVQVIRLRADAKGYHPWRLEVTVGRPVELIIDAEELTACNRTLELPSLDLVIDLKRGENMLRFTPKQAKTHSFTCWMGMLGGTLVVREPSQIPSQRDADD